MYKCNECINILKWFYIVMICYVCIFSNCFTPPSEKITVTRFLFINVKRKREREREKSERGGEG